MMASTSRHIVLSWRTPSGDQCPPAHRAHFFALTLANAAIALLIIIITSLISSASGFRSPAMLASASARWRPPQRLALSDFTALQAIHRSLRDTVTSNVANRSMILPPDPTKLFFASWEFSRGPCTFDGVLCGIVHGELRVVSLSLGIASGGSAGLHGWLPEEIGQLTALVQLTLAPGRVGGPIPGSAIGRLKNLQNLGLSHNLMTGTIPTTLGGLKRLQMLDLSFNRLSGAVPGELSGLPALLTLRLAHNRLTGSLPASFRGAARLDHVDAKRNSLEGPLPEFPGSLTYLDLSRNRLSGPLARSVSGLNQLTYLDLGDNQLSGRVPPGLFSAPLSALVLRHNALSGPVSPPGPVSIPTVDMAFNALSGEISPFFAAARNLYLNHNRFSGGVPREVVERLEAGAMRTLFVQQNFLTGFPLGPAATLPVSASVCIQYNCMAPPIESACPRSGGMRAIRPSSQCRNT